MNKKIPLEERARTLLLFNIFEKDERYSFTNPANKGETAFLKSHNYIVYAGKNNESDRHAVTNEGIRFAINEQKPYNS